MLTYYTGGRKMLCLNKYLFIALRCGLRQGLMLHAIVVGKRLWRTTCEWDCTNKNSVSRLIADAGLL